MSGPSWSAGDDLEEMRLPPVTRLQLIKYAGASGDYNPIHTIDEAAKEAGLPGVIAHGMLTAATLGNLFSPYLEHGFIKSLHVRFSGMVFVGDELCIGGRVVGIEETEAGMIHGIEVYARRDGDTVASGSIEFLVYAE